MFGFCQGVSINPTEYDEQKKNLSLFAEPMKENVTVDLAAEWGSPSCPKIYPLDQQEWEDEIIWSNSPLARHASSEICTTSGIDSEAFGNIETDLEIRPRELVSQVQMEPNEQGYSIFLPSFPVSVEPFDSKNISESVSIPSSKNNHPQLLRLESCMRNDESNYSEGSKESAIEQLHKGGMIKNFSKLSLQNLDMLEDSWLGKIIWDPDVSITKPKLILDLRNEQMLFEILETQDVKDVWLNVGAMIVMRFTKENWGDSFYLPGQSGASIGCFNISNDKYYSNRKTSQQLKSFEKTCSSWPAFNTCPETADSETKIEQVSASWHSKDIANFHRPKALWYPHDNEVAAKEQDLKPSEKVHIFYSGKKLEESKSLAKENVRPNHVLHLVRTKIQLLPRAQKLPFENKSLRPPGAFKKKSDLSVKDGHVFLMESTIAHTSIMWQSSFNETWRKRRKKLPEMTDEYLNEQRPSRSERRLPERNWGSKRRPVMDLERYSAEHAPQTKRHRGGAGEVGLANILESIVESLGDATEVSYLFLKPVSKKEAPDYLDVIKHPMDLAIIKEKVRKMEYKSREGFRHDLWQITFNAHLYNDGRNPDIPLADQLLELCDCLLEQNDECLCEAEAGIEIIDP